MSATLPPPGQRAIAFVDQRPVHYRRWGQGPVVLALHGSPQSSRTLAALAAPLVAAGFCVIAPDAPGNGLSAPLPGAERAGSADYAAALARFADALGLERFALYGFHTGAATACAFAALYPGRVTALACEGLPAWSDEERGELMQGYLPPFEPQWDGSHLCWLWARMEEQTLFFPWHVASAPRRMDYDVAGTAHCHANVLDLLDAGDHYRPVYRAAFTFRPEPWLERLGMPRLFAAQASDVLSVHLNRPAFAGCDTAVFDQPAALHAAILALFQAHPGTPAPAAPTSGTDDQGLTAGWCGAPGRALAWRGSLQGAGRPLVLLHGAGESAARYDELLPLLAADRPVLALDLPGHGRSDLREDCPDRVAALAEEVAAACAGLDLEDWVAAGTGLGGQIAVALAAAGRARGAALLGAAAPAPAGAAAWVARAAPSLAPEWDGAHLVRAFRIARWQRLFHPWFERNRAHALAPFETLDPVAIHRRAVELIRAGTGASWQAATRAEADFDLVTAARGVEALALLAPAGDPAARPERLAPFGRPATALPDTVPGWAGALATCLS